MLKLKSKLSVVNYLIHLYANISMLSSQPEFGSAYRQESSENSPAAWMDHLCYCLGQLSSIAD